MFVKQENFEQNVRANKVVLQELSTFLTGHIQSRSSILPSWDFRFMTMVAQWLVEQGGYTMNPEGNNPGNVVGTGDIGFFTRPYNTEFVKGKRVPRPDVKFAKYSSMDYATNKKFEILADRWPLAYQAILAGSPSAVYVNGLFPGHGKDYATAARVDYVNGVTFRLKRTVAHYILACEDDMKEVDENASRIGNAPPAPGESLDYRNDAGMNKNSRSMLEGLLAELKKLQERVKTGQAIQV
ncbi:MAG: hypothetical protein ABI878_06715 [Acidobacteriota bacterium]